jgi:type VI secretion system secreted protein VgrG
MADTQDEARTFSGLRKAITGQQRYFLEVQGTEGIGDISVVSFRAVEKMGQPYRIDIAVTHPDGLARAAILGHEARFTLGGEDESEPRVFCGRITRFSHTGTTQDQNSYEVVIESHIGCLNLRTTQIYQNQSAPAIIESILRRNGLVGHQFIFRLRRRYPVHPFRLQYQTGDWNFIHILMQQEGLYSYIVQGDSGDVVVFGDDIDHYIYTPALTVPQRAISGMSTSEESVSVLRTNTTLVPAAFTVADYNPDSAWERFRADANVARKDTTTYGQPYVYGTHHLDADGAKWQAQLRHEAALAWQVLYEGESNVHGLCAGRILHTDTEQPDAPNGQVMIEVTHTGARDQPYRNTYMAIPSDRRFRLKIEDDAWPKISGTLSARVTSPDRYKYAYLTQQGYYVVRFDFDFGEWPGGGESVPLRLAKPFAGALQTGFHFPLLDGTEVKVGFENGDVNRPYIAHAMHNSQALDLITNQDRWLSRNVIRTQSDNKVEFEDWEGEEHVKLSTPHAGKSQLNLGHIVNGRREHRGSGLEARTDGHAAVRAGAGLLLSTDLQQQAGGRLTDMTEAMKLFQTLQAQAQELADLATTAKAEVADLKAENAWLRNSVNDLKEAVMLLSSPKGIAVSTPDRVSIGAGRDVNVTTATGFNVSALKSICMAAEGALSLFAHTLGIRLLAARGKVQIQAQGDELAMSSLKDMTVTSTAGKVVISADKELWLGAGGSYIRINAHRIENGTPGDFFVKALTFQKNSPGSEIKNAVLPHANDMPDTGAHGSRFSG